jgi:hypothetical protein
MRDTIQSLWIGGRLGVMQQVSLGSFVAQGHPVHLYAYEPPRGVPEQVVVKNAEEILSAGEVFSYRRGFGRGSPSAFSNWFRYKLLFERGGWWADTDVVCLRPLEFDAEHVMGFERVREGGLRVGSALLKAPAGSEVAGRCWRLSREVDRGRVRWGQIGPNLVDTVVRQVGLIESVHSPDTFYPVDYWEMPRFITGPVDCSDSYGVHLWQEVWRAHGMDPDARFPAECAWEQWKARYRPGHAGLDEPVVDVAGRLRAAIPHRVSSASRSLVVRWWRKVLGRWAEAR